MPVPTSIDDLDPTASNNSPGGGEAVFPNLDNYLRAGFGFTAELRNKLNGTTPITNPSVSGGTFSRPVISAPDVSGGTWSGATLLSPTLSSATINGTIASAGTLTVNATAVAFTGDAFVKSLTLANTNNASPTAIDYYEEGTFTPALEFDGSSTGITYASRDGRYIRLGGMVFFSVSITLSSKGTATGAARITGLPVIDNTIASSVPLFLFNASTNIRESKGIIGPFGGGIITLWGIDTSGPVIQLPNTLFNNNTQIYLTGHWFVV